MKTIMKKISLFALASVMLLAACKKEEYSFGELESPSDVSLTTVIQGATTNAPTGDGSGNVSITLSAKDAISFKLDFGDGQSKMVTPGTHVHKYAMPGTFEYVITVNAIGTGGSISTLTKKVSVLTLFDIPVEIMSSLTGGSSKIWVVDKDAPGHFGVGPGPNFPGNPETFWPSWYSATPTERTSAEYDDEITFAKAGANSVSMVLDNKGQTFFVPEYQAYHGTSGGELQNFDATGTKVLAFSGATSNTTSANSTRIQFMVPGHGLVSWGVGANTYEILSLTPTTMTIRSIGINNKAWYQKLKVK
ncbi:MAG: hypothetical protein RI924_986 [Bacteroidota bacterium]|jgi:hypothetical protein